ncbi:PRC-barrel domain containing protein [Roseomonas arctica]|uniref:PRC-barrel domain containing protein n=2 Tax=Plastoroseomonas arctica TaxID=1509237 RepID=A0AAF1K0I2_9PROT|nr:PRC-barrel domain containing protein [Plastoroseomonas arctica]
MNDHSLISSDRVEGTSVYNTAGDKLGSIHTLMIEKTSGHVSYAVMSFGGFLGLGESYHPLPWNQLHYSTEHDGYVVALTEEQLKGGPRYETANESDWSRDNRSWPTVVDSYYGTAGADLGGVGPMADRTRRL